MSKINVFIVIFFVFISLRADGTPAEGSGTENDPYQIATLDNLLWLSTTETVWDGNYYFLQTEDIDASDTQTWNEGEEFYPIGQQLLHFHGHYNGNNHVIDCLYISRTDHMDHQCVGLFGYTDGAVIEALGVINANLSGLSMVGSIVGWNKYSTISQCYASGNLTGINNIGGIAGWNMSSTISQCYANCDETGFSDLGGLVGINQSNSLISECYATGDIDGGHHAGGLAGSNSEGSTIINSYAIGSVTGGSATGGFVGGNYNSEISNSIWNIETSGQTEGVEENDGGTIVNLLGEATSEMQMMDSYTDIGWDFVGEIFNGTEDIWNLHSALNNGYPYISALEWSYYGNGLLARFEAVPTFGIMPLAVNFTDESISQSNIITWEWDFENDGEIDSYEQNPVWVYNEPGIYSVSLTVTDDTYRASSTEVKENYITVYDNIQPQGSGTESDPYLVESLDNLLWISLNASCWSSHFLQTQDIYASETETWHNGAGFSPIGLTNANSFQGCYNGNNHFIDGLYINRPYSINTGFWGYTSSAFIEGLSMINIEVTGAESVGGLAGYIYETTVSKCHVSGIINGATYAGGIAGTNVDSEISKCYVRGSVYGDSEIGGLTGRNSNSTISNCYSRSSVSGNGINIGGLAGNNLGTAISNSYATGWVTGNESSGGLAGYNDSTISNCIWNTETCGQNFGIGYQAGTSYNLLAATGNEMHLMSTYTDIGWDFVGEVANGSDDIWDIDTALNGGYTWLSDLEWTYNGNGLSAQFEGVPTTGAIPLTVSFTDESVSASDIVTWEWDFDCDGEIDSYDQNPEWEYLEPGTYSVSLTVIDDATRETSIEIKTNYITTYDALQPQGNGTEADPYLVSSLDHLLWISTNLNSWNSAFLQTADINAADTQNWNEGAGFSPIGNYDDAQFCGSYNGNGHVIDSLYINRPDIDRVGLFGSTAGANISSLGVIDANISGEYGVGILAGVNGNYSTITNCYTSGNVSGLRDTGCLVGANSSSIISECHASGTVSGDRPVGGLTGTNYNSVINKCYSNCIVTGTHSYIGGLVGRNYSTICESFYDYETVLINNQHVITTGALGSELYNEWLESGLELEITDYLVYDGEHYLISSSEDFEKLLAFGQGAENSFLLTSDINLTDLQNFYIPYFAGTFNGGYNKIEGLNVELPGFSNIGLFGFTTGATIESLGVTGFNLSASRYTGGLVGHNNGSSISECYSNGSLIGSFYIAGGLVGYNEGSTIIKSYADVRILGESSFAGSLVGSNANSTISECYVIGAVDGYDQIGGLVGKNEDSTISNCYMTGSVTGSYGIGGLVGYNLSMISNSIWNIETTGQTNGVGFDEEGTTLNLLGATTAEMQMMSTYTDIGWDFVGESINGIEDIWDMNDEINEGFPFIYDLEFPVSNDEAVIENGKWKMENYPNPFNPVTNICFEIKESSDVLVKIYNLRGQKVETLIDGYCEAGKHSIIWNADKFGSGVYFIYFESGTMSEVKKITLLK